MNRCRVVCVSKWGLDISSIRSDHSFFKNKWFSSGQTRTTDENDCIVPCASPSVWHVLVQKPLFVIGVDAFVLASRMAAWGRIHGRASPGRIISPEHWTEADPAESYPDLHPCWQVHIHDSFPENMEYWLPRHLLSLPMYFLYTYIFTLDDSIHGFYVWLLRWQCMTVKLWEWYMLQLRLRLKERSVPVYNML